MKETLKTLHASLPQAGAHFRVCLTGSGQLQEQMETVDPGSFELLMSGVKSDIASFVHGPLRRQFIEHYDMSGVAPKSSHIDMNAVLSDSSFKLEVGVRLMFSWDLPGEMRQDVATAVVASCFQSASAGAARAEARLAAAVAPTAQQLTGISQVANLPPGAMQYAVQQQLMQGAPQMSVVAQTSSDDSMGPGQYL